MPVLTPIPTQHRFVRAGLACLLLLSSVPVFARGPEPPLRIPLENIGFQPLSTQFLLNGSSMLTVHFVDDKHLLVTFVVHRLIPRLPNEPEDDQDRVVDAVLLELPTGKILARTSWHLHDHAQYLWSIGHGHFLLRVRDTLTTFAPLANLSTREPFAQHPFLDSADRRLAAVLVSPEADLLIIESVKREPLAKTPKTPLFGPTPSPTPVLTERDPVQINFYRVHATEDGGPVQGRAAGAVKSRNTGDIPATTAGYLAVVDQGHPHWAFDFHSYTGKINELSPFDSTCSPAPLFVSHSEFIAFGCRTAQTMQELGGFNMRGEEMWEQGLFGDFVSPSLAFAPAGGRFALSRVMLHGSVVPDQPISPDEISAQTVVVYQTGTGKQLLRADCSPVERAGQNFALSPDGMALAIVHNDAIEIYTLPALTTKDQSDIKLALSIAPPENDVPVHFTGRATTSNDADAASPPTSQPQPATPTDATNTPPDSTQPASSSQPTAPNQAASSIQPSNQPASHDAEATQPPSAAPATQSSGDTAPEQRRAPPTLYTLPGDKNPGSSPANPKDPQ
jgi:hypothetical protein